MSATDAQGPTASSAILSAAPPEALEPLVRLARRARRPLERFVRIQAASGIVLLAATAVALVAFFIMPVFALANAGVSLSGLALDGPSPTVAAGAAVGLVLGKPLGILLFSGVLLKLRVVALPRGLAFRHPERLLPRTKRRDPPSHDLEHIQHSAPHPCPLMILSGAIHDDLVWYRLLSLGRRSGGGRGGAGRADRRAGPAPPRRRRAGRRAGA